MKKLRGQAALAESKQLAPQTPVKVRRGLEVRRTAGGIPVIRHHYTADPSRDPELNPSWKEAERKTYTSQASWDREQEIRDEAGGGELVLADTLITYWKKIVITDPAWRPDPNWEVEAGFDHGKTNATAFERGYIDYDGVIYLCGEYYMPGKEIFEHAPILRQMADILKVRAAYADPSIFPQVLQQSQLPGKPAERAKSINELYIEQYIELFSPFMGDRSDVSAAARMMAHWRDLDKREPTLKIVCRNYSERPQPGLHDWDCPNLVWEMMRLRREKLTAQQLLSRNVSEAIVQKDNHAWDASKYLFMSHPEPSYKTAKQLAAEAVRHLIEAGDLNSAVIRTNQMLAESVSQNRPARIGRYIPWSQRRGY
jgi:hypothetical protein